MQEWRAVNEFPGYFVSDVGYVRNDRTDRIMTNLVNQFGVVNVSLMRNGIQHKRAVSHLVAKAFIPKPTRGDALIDMYEDRFNTPINLNGDKFDNRVNNLQWRPRWFAVQYSRQFIIGPASIKRPIYEIKTGEEFPNSWEAALTYGLLDVEILASMVERTYVWPTYQQFDLIR